MKRLIIAAVALLAFSGTAYAAAPDTVRALAEACGLPCC